MPDRTPIVAQVRHAERLSASLVRVVVGGPELAGLRPVHADSYVKILFADPDDEAAPARMRTYTVRAFDPEARELTLDFVVHGASGLAGPWAAAARPGDEVRMLGPGGGYSPDPTADFHVLAGDESALPAIAVALERLPADAHVHAVVEVAGPTDHVELPGPVTWLHRGFGPVGTRLVESVTGWPVPAGRGHWFVHGEAAMVRDVRRYLRRDLGLPVEQLSISGYWRAGIDDEGWRSVKRDWNRAVDESERDVAAAS